jgi:hypothetical protein
MTFGSDFHTDQLEQVNVYAQDIQKFLQEIRDYVKDCAEVERDYADKMDRLGKTYSKRLRKLSGLLYGAHAMKWKEKQRPGSGIAISSPNDKSHGFSLGSSGPTPTTATTAIDEDTSSMFSTEEDADLSTLMRSWMVMLHEGTLSGHQHRVLNESLLSMVTDPLKNHINFLDELRRQHVQFAGKLTSDLDKNLQEVEKMRIRHDEACKRYESAQNALDKCPKDLNNECERLRRHCDQMRQSQREAFNDYLLAVDTAQVHQQKHYREDIPMLMDRLQSLVEYQSGQLKRLLLVQVAQQSQTRTEEIKYWDRVRANINLIDENADSDLFIKHHRRVYTEELPTIQFQPILPFPSSSSSSPMATMTPTKLSPSSDRSSPESISRQSLMIEEEPVRIILDNQLHKLRMELDETEPSLAVQSKQIEGLQKLFEAYTRQPELGDPNQVQEVRQTRQCSPLMNMILSKFTIPLPSCPSICLYLWIRI